MKLTRCLLCLFLFFERTAVFSDYSKSDINLSDIIFPKEVTFLKKGDIISYARVSAKGEVWSGGIKAEFPLKENKFFSDHNSSTIAAVEKIFFKAQPKFGEKIFSAVTEFSAIKGTSYYSISEGKILPLITAVEMVEINKITDKQSNILHCIFSVTDNRLGKILFRGNILKKENLIHISLYNEYPVYKYGLKVFDKGDYRVQKVFIYDNSLNGWFYCSTIFMNVYSGILKKTDLLGPKNIANRLRGDSVRVLSLLGIDKSSQLCAFR